MNFLLGYLKDYKKESILAPLFKMLEAIFELLVPLVMASIIDRGIAHANANYVIKMCGMLILLAILGLAFAVSAQYFAAKAAIFSASKMREDLFSHIMDMSAESHGKIGTSVLITRITSDINQIQNGINLFLRLFLRSPFIVFGAMIMAATIHGKATWYFLMVILLLAGVVWFVMKSTLPVFSSIQKQMEKLFLAVGQNLEGARVLRAFGAQEQQMQEFHRETEELYVRQRKAGDVSALLNPVTYVIVNIGVVALLWFGGQQVQKGTLLTGEVVALVNYMSQILVELIKLANLIVVLMRALPSVERVENVMQTPVDQRKKTGSDITEETDMALVLEDVSFCYPDASEPAIAHVSLQLKKQQCLGIIGGTGSGKSTLLQLLTHQFDITSGKLSLFGQEITAYSDKEIADIVGVVFQKAVLFRGTIKENIVFGRTGISEKDISQAIAYAQAENVVASKKNGLEEEILQDARNLSGGQRQRLTIARALAHKPKLIILDDAASALDAATDAALRRDLKQLPWQPTTVIISQRASSVMHADQILVMEDGACVGLGTHEALLQSNQVYQEIYYSQFPREEETI